MGKVRAQATKWIHVDDHVPDKNGFYKCFAKDFSRPIKCRFRKEIINDVELMPWHFIHKKRIPFVIYWREK